MAKILTKSNLLIKRVVLFAPLCASAFIADAVIVVEPLEHELDLTQTCVRRFTFSLAESIPPVIIHT